MQTTEIIVIGMTCQHCIASVQEELSEIQGVTQVAIDLSTGKVHITSETSVPQEAIVAAVTEAGYSLA